MTKTSSKLLKQQTHIIFDRSTFLKGLFCLFLVSLLAITVPAQPFGFRAPEGVKKVELPFQFQNGFIIIDVLFQKYLPMKFVFDTGAEYTILTKKEMAEKLGVNYQKRYRILGSDRTTELIAYLARGISLETNGLLASSQDILVLEEDYFRLDEFTGVNIQGIMGANFFRHMIFEINYKRQVITFYFPEHFKAKQLKDFTEFDISIYKGKPYLDCSLEVLADQRMQAKLLLDTGASLGLLLHADTVGLLKMPPNVLAGEIGSGLGGQLNGFMGRIAQIKLKDFEFDGLVANFQEVDRNLDTSFLNRRNGILGNYLLDRFTVVFDYIHQKLYLRPRRNYNKGFRYDRSGLTLIASGTNLNQYMIKNVLKGSPAAEAGFQAGDQIIGVNRINRRFYDLNHLNKLLQKKQGKRIRMKILRGGEKKIIEFYLRDLV